MHHSPLRINSKEIKAIPVETQTGPDFGHLLMVTFWMQDNRRMDILFTKDGEFVLQHPRLEALSAFFKKVFQPASFDGQPCLINKIKN